MAHNKRNYGYWLSMIGVKKNVVVFFGLFLVGMLFVPTGIPFMVPEAAGSTAQYTITDDATGGDCTTIGAWNSSTKTCTLTGDITVGQVHAIEIGSNGITISAAASDAASAASAAV